jgi:hypothetical protein
LSRRLSLTSLSKNSAAYRENTQGDRNSQFPYIHNFPFQKVFVYKKIR